LFTGRLLFVVPWEVIDSKGKRGWRGLRYGEKPGEFKFALSGFGVDGDKECWLGFLANAKQIFETYGDIPVHWAPYEQTYLHRHVERFGDPEGIAARVGANRLPEFEQLHGGLTLLDSSFFEANP
jgi:hypothetical protein